MRAFNFQNLHGAVKGFVAESFPCSQVKACYQITAGLSNHNYLLVVEQSKYLLKLYQKDMPIPSLTFQGFLAATMPNIQDVIRWDAALKVALFTYVDEAVAGIDKKRLCNLVETIALVHKQPSVNLSVSLDLKQALSDLSLTFKQRTHSELSYCLHLLESYPKELGCCHNDLVRENLIPTEDGVIVIDFEYAAIGDVYFDLAAVATSFWMNDEDIVRMLAIYYDQMGLKVPDYAVEKLRGFRVAYLLLCISWYEERGEAEKAASLLSQLDELNAT